MERGLDLAFFQRLSISRVHDISRLVWALLLNNPPSDRAGKSLGVGNGAERDVDDFRRVNVTLGITLKTIK